MEVVARTVGAEDAGREQGQADLAALERRLHEALAGLQAEFDATMADHADKPRRERRMAARVLGAAKAKVEASLRRQFAQAVKDYDPATGMFGAAHAEAERLIAEALGGI